jgi:hypothetical protein
MRGNLALERGRWREACDEYRTAMSLCESIASSAASSGSGEKVAVVVGVVDGEEEEEEDDDDDDDLRRLELFDFFATRARNVIAPLLRYCHYELQVRGVPSPPLVVVAVFHHPGSVPKKRIDLAPDPPHRLTILSVTFTKKTHTHRKRECLPRK